MTERPGPTGDDRAVRGRSCGQPLPDVESDVFGVVLPRAGQGGGDTQEGTKGGVRVLGMPTIADRVAQAAVAMSLEPLWSRSSTRTPMAIARASPVDAVAVCRERCWK